MAVELLSYDGLGNNATEPYTKNVSIDPACNFLIVFAGSRNLDSDIPSCTAGGITMNILNTHTWGQFFYLANPPTGTVTITVSYSGPVAFYPTWVCAGLANVDPDDPFVDEGWNWRANPAALTGMQANDMCLNFVAVGSYSGTPPDPSPGAGETVFANAASVNGSRSKGAYKANPASSETLTWTTGDVRRAVALRFKPSSDAKVLWFT